jgi:hypothetical protein
MAIDRKLYILKIASVEGIDTGRQQYSTTGSVDELYAVIAVADEGVAIVDDGYRDPIEAKESWPEATYGAGAR